MCGERGEPALSQAFLQFTLSPPRAAWRAGWTSRGSEPREASATATPQGHRHLGQRESLARRSATSPPPHPDPRPQGESCPTLSRNQAAVSRVEPQLGASSAASRAQWHRPRPAPGRDGQQQPDHVAPSPWGL